MMNSAASSGAPAWRAPLLTVLSMLATLAAVWALQRRLLPAGADQAGPLVMAGTLAMVFSRSRFTSTWKARGEALCLLPLLAILTLAVGALFKFNLLLAAIAFISAMFASVWLRQFGPMWSRVGGLLALPMMSLLIVPGGGGPTMTPVWAVAIAWVAAGVVIAIHALAAQWGWASPEALLAAPVSTPSEPSPAAASSAAPAASTSTSTTPEARWPVSTRMAVQLACALAAASVLGWLCFPDHLTWTVLTALLVCFGNRGRLDVVHKSGLRIVGAAAGTGLAVWMSQLTTWLEMSAVVPWHSGCTLTVLLVALIGLGLWLRTWTYAAWALAMTLVIGVLQNDVFQATTADVGTANDSLMHGLLMRMAAIIVGAICGVAATWWVMPVRSSAVLHLRLAEVLAALSEYAAAPTPENQVRLKFALARLEEVAPPWRTIERISRWHGEVPWPARWLLLTEGSARAICAQTTVPGNVRRALGEARKALREPEKLGPALVALSQVCEVLAL